jgi:hypothetical protein
VLAAYIEDSILLFSPNVNSDHLTLIFPLAALTVAILTMLHNFVMGDPDEFGEAGTHVTGSTERPKHDENGREYLESDDPVKDVQIDDAQRGVQNIQATTMAWTKTSLPTLLILDVSRRSHSYEQLADSTSIWVPSLTNGFRGAILASLTPYVTSDFSSHSLLTGPTERSACEEKDYECQEW